MWVCRKWIWFNSGLRSVQTKLLKRSVCLSGFLSRHSDRLQFRSFTSTINNVTEISKDTFSLNARLYKSTFLLFFSSWVWHLVTVGEFTCWSRQLNLTIISLGFIMFSFPSDVKREPPCGSGLDESPIKTSNVQQCNGLNFKPEAICSLVELILEDPK